LERQSYGYGAAPTADRMFAATSVRGYELENEPGFGLAGIPADNCANRFHNVTSWIFSSKILAYL